MSKGSIDKLFSKREKKIKGGQLKGRDKGKFKKMPSFKGMKRTKRK